MNTHDQLWLGARWQGVVLALLPGLFVIAQRSGLLQRLGGPYPLFGNDDAVLVLCLALVLVSWLC